MIFCTIILHMVPEFFRWRRKEEEAIPPLAPMTRPLSSLNQDALEAHLRTDRYGPFHLTDGIRPSTNFRPEQGYRHDVYYDQEARSQVPVIMAAATRTILFELFMEIINPLGRDVDVVLETSHRCESGHSDLYREHIELPILKSWLFDYEDLLTNDGCTGIALLNPRRPQEVQFDEHKLLIVYGNPLKKFERVLESYGIRHNPDIKFITEDEHVHSSNDEYAKEFRRLATQLGMDGGDDYDDDDDDVLLP